jgi:hypothetical protein
VFAGMTPPNPDTDTAHATHGFGTLIRVNGPGARRVRPGKGLVAVQTTRRSRRIRHSPWVWRQQRQYFSVVRTAQALGALPRHAGFLTKFNFVSSGPASVAAWFGRVLGASRVSRSVT